MSLNKEFIAETFRSIQLEICEAIEKIDGSSRFIEDQWTREAGGGGQSRIITHGDVIEKGGVNFSAVHGPLPAFLAKEMNQKSDLRFFATGVSIVIHPKNPWVPIIHMNIRYFEMSNGRYWFGGGIDLTPHYIRPEQVRLFHQKLETICNQFDNTYYPQFKKWADEYFFIPHRNETRGVGGIFFDHLSENENQSKKTLFDFACALGRNFASLYEEQVNLNKHLIFSEEHLRWQKIRRGRYVEFNLVYDRGTRFGLETGGRTESILMSLPENASWFYNYQYNPLELETVKLLRQNVDWLRA